MRHPVAGERMTVNHPCLVIVPSLWRHKLARGCQQSVPIIQCSVDVDPSKGREGAGSLSLFRGGSRVLAVTNQVHKVTQRYTPGTQRHAQVHKGTLQVGSQGNKNFGEMQTWYIILHSDIYKGAVWRASKCCASAICLQNGWKIRTKGAKCAQNRCKIGAMRVNHLQFAFNSWQDLSNQAATLDREKWTFLVSDLHFTCFWFTASRCSCENTLECI